MNIVNMALDYFWTQEQEDILRKAYKEGSGLREAAELLAPKSRGTIAAKACRMKITNPKPRYVEDKSRESSSGINVSLGGDDPDPPAVTITH